MYIQYCVKGISGGTGGITEDQAREIVVDAAGNPSRRGVSSNWLRRVGPVDAVQIADALTETALDRHLHDYAAFGRDTPFISLACGSVERQAQANAIYSAIDTALGFATGYWKHPGALVYLWVPTGHYPAVGLSVVAEPVRDLNIYQRWSPNQLEGEITAKVHIPANQIERVEWWDGDRDRTATVWQAANPGYIAPALLGNIRELF